MKTARKVDASPLSKTGKEANSENALRQGHAVNPGPEFPQAEDEKVSLRDSGAVDSTVAAADKASGDLPSAAPGSGAIKDSPRSQPNSGTDCSTLDATALDPSSPTCIRTHPGVTTAAEVDEIPEDTKGACSPPASAIMAKAKESTSTEPQSSERTTSLAAPPDSPSLAAGNDATRDDSPPSTSPPPAGGPADAEAEAPTSGRRKRSRKVPAKLADAAVLGLSGRGRGPARPPAKRPRDDAAATAAVAPAAAPADCPLTEASTATAVHVGEQMPPAAGPPVTAAAPPPPPPRRRRKGAPSRAE